MEKFGHSLSVKYSGQRLAHVYNILIMVQGQLTPFSGGQWIHKLVWRDSPREDTLHPTGFLWVQPQLILGGSVGSEAGVLGVSMCVCWGVTLASHRFCSVGTSPI